jgi:DNA-directed RNA polymerase specialized sigma24 family protein
MTAPRTHARFQTTQWTLLAALRGEDGAERRAAMEALVGRYWAPVYACFRHLGRTRDQAEELTQDFFARVVLERGLLEYGDPQRGRLRTLLWAALKRFLVDDVRREKRRDGGASVSLDGLEEEDRIVAVAAGASADEAFDRRWALKVLEEAMQRCARHFQACGREAHWALFEARVARPAFSMTAAPPLEAMAGPMGFATAADAAAAVQTVKRRLLALLHEVAAETAVGEQDQEEEVRFVLGMLGGG